MDVSAELPVDVDGILDLLEESAEFNDGEVVDLLTHALQCASLLAESHPSDLELQVAGLVHDLGHVLLPGDDLRHPAASAGLVAHVLGERVAFLVRHHADAKRYLVDTDPKYVEALSPRSRESLVAQGGPLAPEERALLEHSHDIDALCALRRADDAAKVPGATTPALLTWLPVLRAVAGHAD